MSASMSDESYHARRRGRQNLVSWSWAVPIASQGDVRSGSRLCENSDVGLARRKFVSITLNKKRTALAVTVERRKERKQFCAFSARARFHTAWVKNGPDGPETPLPGY